MNQTCKSTTVAICESMIYSHQMESFNAAKAHTRQDRPEKPKKPPNLTTRLDNLFAMPDRLNWQDRSEPANPFDSYIDFINYFSNNRFLDS